MDWNVGRGGVDGGRWAGTVACGGIPAATGIALALAMYGHPALSGDHDAGGPTAPTVDPRARRS